MEMQFSCFSEGTDNSDLDPDSCTGKLVCKGQQKSETKIILDNKSSFFTV